MRSFEWGPAPTRRGSAVTCALLGASFLACHGQAATIEPPIDAGPPVEDADVTSIVIPQGGVFRVGGRNQCSRERDRESTLKALAAAPNLAIARVRVLEECSGLGGNHIFAKTERVLRGEPGTSIHSGGHGCATWAMGEHKPYVSFEAYAVIGYHMQPPEDVKGGASWCIEDTRDGDIDAMVVYDASDPAEELGKALALPH